MALLLLDDDTLELLVTYCELRDLNGLLRSCRRFNQATSRRMAAISALAAPPFNLAFERVCAHEKVNLLSRGLENADLQTLSLALANGAMANTTVSSEPSHSCSGLRLTVHTFLTLFCCTH